MEVFYKMILIPVLAAALFALIFFYYDQKYKKTSYYKNTKQPYLSVLNNSGRYGEYLAYKKLERLENSGAKFLFNLYIPKSNGETTEIDMIMICSKGIFVFESKNYSGWIFGSENQKNWCQTLPQGRGKSRKEHFYNPIMQNNSHIKNLKTFLREDIPMHSIITFSERCTLKSINIQSNNIHIIHRNAVFNVVKQICCQNSEDILNTEKISYIYNMLYPYTQTEDKIKKQHIETIQQNTKTETENTTISTKAAETEKNIQPENITESEIVCTIHIESEEQDLRCPKCNNNLILRTATKGKNMGKQFYGCSNFPRCRYIQNIK